MKALSLLQPWAILLVRGEKKIETRSWKTSYRGPVAIHASAEFSAYHRGLCNTWPFARVLPKNGYMLPTGAVLGTAELFDIRPTAVVREGITDIERELGDYSEGRFAWYFRDFKPLAMAIEAKGSLGLWKFEPNASGLLDLVDPGHLIADARKEAA